MNTAQEFDGSDAGARPDEAVSWGKIKVGGDSVKVSSKSLLLAPWMIVKGEKDGLTGGVGVCGGHGCVSTHRGGHVRQGWAKGWGLSGNCVGPI